MGQLLFFWVFCFCVALRVFAGLGVCEFALRLAGLWVGGFVLRFAGLWVGGFCFVLCPFHLSKNLSMRKVNFSVMLFAGSYSQEKMHPGIQLSH